MTPFVEIDISGFDEFIKHIDSVSTKVSGIGNIEIKAGVLQEQAGKVYDGTDTTLGEVATINEFGNAEQNIPQRSFIRSAFDENISILDNGLEEFTDSLISESNTKSINSYINDIGMLLKNKIVEKINTGPFTPNSPVTIKLKGSDKPLIDTGLLINSINYKVKK